MRAWSRALLVVGILAIVFGFASCDHYYRVPLPPEAHEPGWDSEGYIGPIGYMRLGICLAGAGAICCAISCYLYATFRKRGQDAQP